MTSNKVIAYYGGFTYPRRGKPFQDVSIQYAHEEDLRFERVYKSFEFDSCCDEAGNLEIWRVILQIHFGRDPEKKLLDLFKNPVGINSARIEPEELTQYINKKNGLQGVLL